MISVFVKFSHDESYIWILMSRGTDAFLIKSFPAVVQASQVLSFIKIDFMCVSDSDDMCVDFT
jgi:hypothetical protein